MPCHFSGAQYSRILGLQTCSARETSDPIFRTRSPPLFRATTEELVLGLGERVGLRDPCSEQHSQAVENRYGVSSRFLM